jgi:hypothetical protein
MKSQISNLKNLKSQKSQISKISNLKSQISNLMIIFQQAKDIAEIHELQNKLRRVTKICRCPLCIIARRERSITDSDRERQFARKFLKDDQLPEA